MVLNQKKPGILGTTRKTYQNELGFCSGFQKNSLFRFQKEIRIFLGLQKTLPGLHKIYYGITGKNLT